MEELPSRPPLNRNRGALGEPGRATAESAADAPVLICTGPILNVYRPLKVRRAARFSHSESRSPTPDTLIRPGSAYMAASMGGVCCRF